MFRSRLPVLPVVGLLILSSNFLFLLIIRIPNKGLEAFSLPWEWPGNSDSLGDHPNISRFEWKPDLQKTTKARPLNQQPLATATTQHPLKVVYPHVYPFLINEPSKCQEWAPFLVLLVVSKPHDFTERQAIRQTWGNESSVPGVSIIRLFLLGADPLFRSPLQPLLEEESSLYRDIIQQEFLDTYNNLTLKTLMGMEWVTRFCPNATYVMKADSDIFLNVGYLVSKLLQPHLPPKKDYMTGYIYRNTGPLRDKAYKWYVPREVYPNDTYPPYCGGPGYVLSGDLAKKVFQVAQTIPVINMEDSFMGICLYTLGIEVTESPWGLFHVFKVDYEKCRFSELVVVHHYSPEELLQIWPNFTDQNKNCTSQN
ncbi:beta-1,3-galactosyltransferase 1-like [Eublepharis macularius]|uniref:Hexosyltransferase n=1 Tax=Eublepharis macularius TaxID=481883 RepID=A0AA97KZ75_EUBMA|nr:beta-1,3-galactosyltransferase 1-like [Eublepharis macularius]